MVSKHSAVPGAGLWMSKRCRSRQHGLSASQQGRRVVCAAPPQTELNVTTHFAKTAKKGAWVTCIKIWVSGGISIHSWMLACGVQRLSRGVLMFAVAPVRHS